MVMRGARPIVDDQINNHYSQHQYCKLNLGEYADHWRHWLQYSDTKVLAGLSAFEFADSTHGTSQTFEHFILRHSHQRCIAVFRGEFQYHACISKHQKFQPLVTAQDLRPNHAVIISLPFSDQGSEYPGFHDILNRCNQLDIPVCLDLAYWGIAKNIHIDLDQYPCVEQVTASLSKPFFVLENHRVGVRFSRQYLDDGVNMQNEVNMQNLYSMSLGLHFMQKFSSDWNWAKYSSAYFETCKTLNLETTNTVIFGLDRLDRWPEYNRGTPSVSRVCISELLTQGIK